MQEPGLAPKRVSKGVSGQGPGSRSPYDVEFGRVVTRATANSHDLESLTRPLLEALAKLANLESTYLTVFDWGSREQEVRVAHSAGEVQITEGTRIALPEAATPESLPGVTRSPTNLPETHPDSKVARRLGLQAYVSVPVTVAKHQLFGMLCGASRESQEITEHIVSVMEFFSQIIADHVIRTEVAATEQRAETAEEQLRARARFLAIAEHQLKTPLAVVMGVPMTLLQRRSEMSDDELTDALAMIIRNSEELNRLIGELLLEARAEIQARELTPTRLELLPFLQRIAAAFGGVSGLHSVTAQVPEDIVAWADPAAFYQVLGQLLDNAIKFSPDGGMIALQVSRDDPDVQIDVVDEGVGVPEDRDIFEPFQRGSPAETQGTPGIGLGLHIVRNVVQAMGGTVAAHRNPGGGSTFTVRLPATR